MSPKYMDQNLSCKDIWHGVNSLSYNFQAKKHTPYGFFPPYVRTLRSWSPTIKSIDKVNHSTKKKQTFHNKSPIYQDFQLYTHTNQHGLILLSCFSHLIWKEAPALLVFPLPFSHTPNKPIIPNQTCPNYVLKQMYE